MESYFEFAKEIARHQLDPITPHKDNDLSFEDEKEQTWFEIQEEESYAGRVWCNTCCEFRKVVDEFGKPRSASSEDIFFCFECGDRLIGGEL